MPTPSAAAGYDWRPTQPSYPERATLGSKHDHIGQLCKQHGLAVADLLAYAKGQRQEAETGSVPRDPSSAMSTEAFEYRFHKPDTRLGLVVDNCSWAAAVEVSSVHATTEAANRGFETGDLIYQVNKTSTPTADSFVAAYALVPVGGLLVMLIKPHPNRALYERKDLFRLAPVSSRRQRSSVPVTSTSTDL